MTQRERQLERLERMTKEFNQQTAHIPLPILVEIVLAGLTEVQVCNEHDAHRMVFARGTIRRLLEMNVKLMAEREAMATMHLLEHGGHLNS